ncbi:MAG TPA: hypothetical protein GXZ50_12200, partial [Clostridia bacterium]|nr:hypothetical protein [Clostridia bacterium]
INQGGGETFSTINRYVRVQKGRFKGIVGKVIGEKKGKIVIQTDERLIYVPKYYINQISDEGNAIAQNQ